MKTKLALLALFFLSVTACVRQEITNADPKMLSQMMIADSSLITAVSVLRNGSGFLVEGIRDQIEKAGNHPRDLNVLDSAEKIRKLGDQVIRKIIKYRLRLAESVSGPDVPVRLTADNDIYKIEKDMRKYREDILLMSEKVGEKIGPDLPTDFVEKNIKNMPLAVILLQLAQLEFNVARIEQFALENQAVKVGAGMRF